MTAEHQARVGHIRAKLASVVAFLDSTEPADVTRLERCAQALGSTVLLLHKHLKELGSKLGEKPPKPKLTPMQMLQAKVLQRAGLSLEKVEAGLSEDEMARLRKAAEELYDENEPLDVGDGAAP